MTLRIENVKIKHTNTDYVEDGIPFGPIGIYADGKLILEIDEVSDDNTINLFFTPRNNAELVDAKPFQKEIGLEDSEVTHELLWNRKE